MEGKEGKAGGAAPRGAGSALFPSCHFTGLLEKLCQLQGWLCFIIPEALLVLDVSCILTAAATPASLGVPQALGIREHLKGQNQP